MSFLRLASAGLLAVVVVACSKDSTSPSKTPVDPATAPRAMIDRFSATAGHLMVRDATNGLPAAGAAVDFDHEPFLSRGFGPDGKQVYYYNFDTQPTAPAPIYVLYREGESDPVNGQGNIVDAIPGDAGYNDFWQVVKVTVPANYVANTVTSLGEIVAANYATQATNVLVNCPVVPEGSTATIRLTGEDAGLVQGWYRGRVVFYFSFGEAPLTTEPNGQVPVSTIYVTFNVNPGEPGGGPASGFKTETGSTQNHNVLVTIPGDGGYSPLWSVNIYDNAEFAAVHDLMSATDATLLASNAALVNCPVVDVQP
jgi:hypothetical protein